MKKSRVAHWISLTIVPAVLILGMLALFVFSPNGTPSRMASYMVLIIIALTFIFFVPYFMQSKEDRSRITSMIALVIMLVFVCFAFGVLVAVAAFTPQLHH